MEDLKPCPFCGRAVELDEIQIHDNTKIVDYFEIYCSNIDCSVTVKIEGYFKEPIIEAWNTRK